MCAFTEWKDLKTQRFSSPEASRFLHTSQIRSPFDVGVLTHILPPPDLFTWTLRLQLHPHPLLTTQQGQRLCHRCVTATFKVSWRAAQKRRSQRCSPVRVDCRPSSLATPSQSLIPSSVLMQEGDVIVISDYLPLAGKRKIKLWSCHLGLRCCELCARCSWAKFKHTLPDSSSQQWHYP